MNKHLLKNKRHHFLKNIKQNNKEKIKSQKDFIRDQIEKEEKKEEEINKKEELNKKIDKKINMRDLIDKLQDIDLSSDEE